MINLYVRQPHIQRAIGAELYELDLGDDEIATVFLRVCGDQWSIGVLTDTSRHKEVKKFSAYCTIGSKSNLDDVTEKLIQKIYEQTV